MNGVNIVALGGGSFGSEPDNPLLDNYILSLTGVEEPKVCFIPTASGDAERYIQLYYDAYGPKSCVPTHLELFHRSVLDLEAYLLSQHVIYVGGGNTANMLAIWRVHGVDKILLEAARRNILLCGVSAGSLCWFECGVTDSFGVQLAPLHDGLGLLPGSNCPHYDGEVLRRPSYTRYVAEGFPSGYAADDGCGLHFNENGLVQAVSSRPNAAGYRVELTPEGVRETRLETKYLG